MQFAWLCSDDQSIYIIIFRSYVSFGLSSAIVSRYSYVAAGPNSKKELNSPHLVPIHIYYVQTRQRAVPL